MAAISSKPRPLTNTDSFPVYGNSGPEELYWAPQPRPGNLALSKLQYVCRNHQNNKLAGRRYLPVNFVACAFRVVLCLVTTGTQACHACGAPLRGRRSGTALHP